MQGRACAATPSAEGGQRPTAPLFLGAVGRLGGRAAKRRRPRRPVSPRAAQHRAVGALGRGARPGRPPATNASTSSATQGPSRPWARRTGPGVLHDRFPPRGERPSKIEVYSPQVRRWWILEAWADQRRHEILAEMADPARSCPGPSRAHHTCQRQGAIAGATRRLARPLCHLETKRARPVTRTLTPTSPHAYALSRR